MHKLSGLVEHRGVRQFVKFGIVGASGFLVNLVVFTILQRIIPDHARPLQYDIIYSLAFLAGGISNYYFNRRWTFRSSGHAVREGAQFLTVSAVALVVGLIVSALVSPWLGHGHKTWFVATVAGIFVNFFMNKYWTFKHVQ
ncbi:MAG: GtrA family protein [Candidatus Eremiobacteraeota bacterium]|nr:GtrA family protein [Candidatus Eremiobacteraeota bacterium]